MDEEGTWTEADDVQLAFHALADDHPVNVVRSFVATLLDDTSSLAEIASHVTPESLPGWGSFEFAAVFVREAEGVGVAIANRALRAIGASDVTFVKLVPDVQKPVFSPVIVEPLAWVVLVWRPELGGWRIHSIGPQVDPTSLPRTSPGRAPSLG